MLMLCKRKMGPFKDAYQSTQSSAPFNFLQCSILLKPEFGIQVWPMLPDRSRLIRSHDR